MIEPQMNTDEHRLSELTFALNGCAMDVLNKVGHGFHEKIYENALAVAFKNRGISFEQQKSFDVLYENQKVGIFIPDFVIEDKIIIESKVIPKISDIEKGQVINYLKATGLRLGLIMNFKEPTLEWKRIILEK